MAEEGQEKLARKAREVHERLLERFGEHPHVPRREPMHELISTMLSHRTTQQNEATAYQRMRERFGGWEAIAEAPTDELADAISVSNFAEAKAPRIQETLRRIIDERGEASIDFLSDMPTGEAMEWLMALPGVGIKTASLVLLFCFAHPVLPVDTHVHRASGRLGLIPPNTSAKQAHTLLPELLPEEPHVLYNFHINMLRHGQKICVWGTPKCDICPLTDLCDWYSQHAKEAGKEKASDGS